jgi:isopentenyl-diphosphate Delta-isomerase
MEMVILVDENDNSIGTMEKMEAHRKGELHRAFSVLVFNSRGEMLLQKRARTKYHSGGLWTNACCSHPAPGEKIVDAARRRLHEEMGFDCQPEFSYKFIYKTNLDQNMIEHEYDHVFVASFSGRPEVNPQEVEDWKYVELAWLKKDIILRPEVYTYWFRLMIEKHPTDASLS